MWRFFFPPNDELRALRDLYVSLDKRIRDLEDEKRKTRQIVEASQEVRKRATGGKESGWILF